MIGAAAGFPSGQRLSSLRASSYGHAFELIAADRSVSASKFVALLFSWRQGRGMAAPLPLPALHATHAGIWLADGAGDVREATRGEAIARAAETPHIILNAPLVGQRLGYPELSGLDLLEVFAFIHPARFAVPTVAGLSRALGLETVANEAEAAAALQQITERLLSVLGDPDWTEREGAWTSNATLHRLGWGWAPLIGARLERPERGERMLFSRLRQWEEAADRPPPRTITFDPGAA